MMARVDEVMMNLDQLELCVSLLRQTGAFHRKIPGFKSKYFKVSSNNKKIVLLPLKQPNS